MSLSEEEQNDQRLWILTLCECYREALKDERMRTLGFPYKGISRLLRSEYPILKFPFPNVNQTILPTPSNYEKPAALAGVLLNYAEAMVWLAEGLGGIIGARLIKEALDECQMSELERDNSRAKYFLEAVQKKAI